MVDYQQVITGLGSSASDVAGAVTGMAQDAFNNAINTFSSVPSAVTGLASNSTDSNHSESNYLENVPAPSAGTKPDMRARLSAFKDDVYGGDLMAPLVTTNGMLFPYTPTITFSQDVEYQSVNLTHTNLDLQAYSRTPNVTLSVTGKFTAQTQAEAKYAVAVIHFLRTVSKMYFGEEDKKSGMAGLPPPLLKFNAYGTYMFKDLRVILKNHSMTFDEDVSMVDVKVAGGWARVPTLFTIQLTLQVQNTPYKARTEFSLEKFRTGQLMRDHGGWI